MNFNLPEQNLVKTRADFAQGEFRKLIAQKGIRLEWSQAAMCPCAVETGELNIDLNEVGATSIEEVSTQQSMSCPICEGRGRYFHSPQVVRGVVAGADTEWLNARYGGFKDGVVMISLNPEHLASHGDRFKLVDSVLMFKEVVAYKGGATLKTRYPIVQREMDLAEGEVSIGVVYCSYSNAGLGTGLELVEGEDFTINEEGLIEWINAPLVGSRVTLSYYAHPAYTCVGFPHSVRDSRSIKKSPTDYPVTLPVQIQAKLDFLGGE